MWQWVPEDDGGVQSCTGRLRLISSLLRCIGQVLPRLAPHSLDPCSLQSAKDLSCACHGVLLRCLGQSAAVWLELALFIHVGT